MRTKTSMFLVMIFIAVSAFGALPTTDDLIPTWENYVKSRPDTDEFTKIGKGLYKYKSKKFEYEGTIRVIDTEISDANVQDKDFKAATVQIELPNLPPETSKKVSFLTWRRDVTMLWFDVTSSKWLNNEEYTKLSLKMYEKNMKSANSNKISFYDFLIFALVGLFIYAFVQSKIYTKTMKEQYQQALQDSREHQQQVMSELKKTNELLAKLLGGQGEEESKNGN